MSTTASAPLRENQRVKLIDSIRGIALLGILLMNSMAQSQAHMFYDRMDPRQSMTGLNFFAWGAEALFFEGTMRGLFSILFGAGTLLLLTRLIKKNNDLEPVDIYYRRLIWLLVFGLINAFIFLWPGDILYPYALCGLLLFPFRNLSPKNLLWIAFAFLVIGTYRENSDLYGDKKLISEGQVAEALEAKKVKLTEQQQEALGRYKGFKERNNTEGIAKQAKEEYKKVQGQGYGTLFSYYRDVNMRIQSIVFYRIYWWDIFLFFFIGMALFKTGYLSLLILLYKVIPFRKILDVFAPVGQMAFTNYLSQSIITSIIFKRFGLFGNLQRYEVYYVVAAIWAFQIITSHIWLHYYRFGPFEWLWRSLTYNRKQPMKRKKGTEEIEEEKGELLTPALA